MERICPGAPGEIRGHYRVQLSSTTKTIYNGATQAGKTDSKGRIDILDVVGDIAVIRITLENYHGADYVDFHAMKKDESGWKIMAKVFTEA